MGADGELELEQQLVCRRRAEIVDAPILSADLAELARTECQHGGAAVVVAVFEREGLRSVEPQTAGPAARELIVARYVHAPAIREHVVARLTVPPDPFGTPHERSIDGALQR